jgi:hypothetical protein
MCGLLVFGLPPRDSPRRRGNTTSISMLQRPMLRPVARSGRASGANRQMPTAEVIKQLSPVIRGIVRLLPGTRCVRIPMKTAAESC